MNSKRKDTNGGDFEKGDKAITPILLVREGSKYQQMVSRLKKKPWDM